jgi:hypothetical protein
VSQVSLHAESGRSGHREWALMFSALLSVPTADDH